MTKCNFFFQRFSIREEATNLSAFKPCYYDITQQMRERIIFSNLGHIIITPTYWGTSPLDNLFAHYFHTLLEFILFSIVSNSWYFCISFFYTFTFGNFSYTYVPPAAIVTFCHRFW